MLDPHNATAPRGYRDPADDDTEYSFRAMVRHSTDNGVMVWSLFPPAQYKTVESKNEFNRLLNSYLNGLNWVSVEVMQGGKHLYAFDK